MTEAYDWIPMPHLLAVKCPICGCAARFEFAEVVRIARRVDIAFFKNSGDFEYKQFSDSCGHKWHAAIHLAGLHGGNTSSISNLPAGYEKHDWDHSKYWVRSLPNYGAITCSNCLYLKKHWLIWPKDAYFQASIKGHLLWAYDRESCIDLFNFIESKTRDRTRHRYRSFLLHVPKRFLLAKNRHDVLKKLAKLLEN